MIFSRKIIIIIITIALLIILFMGIGYILNNQTIEGVENVSNSNSCTIACESVQNIASIYDTGKMTITDLNVTGSFNLLPTGVIVAWTGTTQPDGWVLCKGQTINGVKIPDLRGRFILGHGSGKGSTMDDTGGAETVALTVNQMPAHNHTTGLVDIPCQGGNCANDSTFGFTQNVTAFRNRINAYPSNVVGGGQGHENMPPYYVLAYIMKL